MNVKINDNKNNLYNNFNINSKSPIHKLNYHTNSIFCLAILNDGRLIPGSCHNNIIIYNKISFQPDLIIKEHKDAIYYIIQLESGIIASCSDDKTIKLFDIKENNYITLQTLDYNKKEISKIIELKNNYLASCSEDKSIIFYSKYNNKYQKEFKIKTKGESRSITQTKENEICYSEYIKNNFNISFFDFYKRKIKSSLSNISICKSKASFDIITKDLLIIGGDNKISIININQYIIVKIVEVPNSIYGFCMIKDNMFLTG